MPYIRRSHNMYVLTVDTGRYSDAETHVVGVFDTIEAMVAAKEAAMSGSSLWDAWEVPQANTYFAPGSLEFERIMTQRELDVIADRVQADNLARQKLVGRAVFRTFRCVQADPRKGTSGS